MSERIPMRKDFETTAAGNIKRSVAEFQEFREHGDHLEHRKVDALPGVLEKGETQEGTTIADRELRRLLNADVFRSNNKTIREMNDQYEVRTTWGTSRPGRKYNS